MKLRPAFFVFAFLGLAFVAYCLSGSRRADVLSSASTRAMGVCSGDGCEEACASASGSSCAAREVLGSGSASGFAPLMRAAASVAAGSSAASLAASTRASAFTTEASALASLQSLSKQGWDLRRDDFTSVIRTLQHGELSSAGLPREAADAFVQTYAQALFGVDADRVKFNREEVTDRTRLIYDQSVNGVPVYGASLSLFYENGALTRVQNDLAPGEIEAGSKAVAVASAFGSYQAVRTDALDITLQTSAMPNRTILYPHAGNLIYATEFVTSESAKSYHVIYDPANQFVIQRRPTAIQ